MNVEQADVGWGGERGGRVKNEGNVKSGKKHRENIQKENVEK